MRIRHPAPKHPAAIFRVPEPPLPPHRLVKFSVATALSAALLLVPAPQASAQVLARPGWAGSGVVPDVWWHNAVFYRVDPTRFQASGSSATGDLPGLIRRLPYLRALGVDALVLDGSFDPSQLGDLLRSASGNQLRVLVTVTPAMQAGDRQALLRQVHDWLGTGTAGLYVPAPGLPIVQQGSDPALLTALAAMLRSLPGDRVLLTDTDLSSAPENSRASRSQHRSGTGLFRMGQDGLLVLRAALPTASSSTGPGLATALRESLTALAAGDTHGGEPLLLFAQAPPTGSPNAFAFAAALFASRGDALLNFGDEIGLDTTRAVAGVAGRPLLPVMQWTPANVQQAAAPVERPGSTPGVTAFGPYRPYVHPPPSTLTGIAPGMPSAAVDAALPPDLPPPDTLPGFTEGHLPTPPVNGERLNVAVEERDARSLLNAYRQLIALHHSNAALGEGAQVVLNRDAQNAVVWVRKAVGQRSGDILIAANLGDGAITLSLNDDLARLGVRTGSLRPLFTASPTALTAEDTGALMLPPHAVFIGEVRRR